MTIFIISCSLNFNFGTKTSTDRKLFKSHTYSEKTNDLTFFYDVKEINGKQLVNITVKNKTHFFISSLAIKVSYDNYADSNYMQLGNLSINATKSFSLEAPIDAKKMQLNCEYQLSREDSFLKSESYGGESEHHFGTDEVELKNEFVVLYLKR